MRGTKAKRVRKAALVLTQSHVKQIEDAWASRPWWLKLWHKFKGVTKPLPIRYGQAKRLVKRLKAY